MCTKERKLDLDSNLSKIVKHLFLDCQWSPEEIEGRLRLEYGKTVVSYQTIYRTIYRGHFDDKFSHGERARIGDWEADTVAGQIGKACLVTLTDRYSRFLKIKKVAVKKSKLVIEAMLQMLEPLPKETVTPDKRKRIHKSSRLD